MKGWLPLAAAAEMPVTASAPATATALPIPSIFLLSFIVFPSVCGERPSGPAAFVSHLPGRLKPPRYPVRQYRVPLVGSMRLHCPEAGVGMPVVYSHLLVIGLAGGLVRWRPGSSL